MNISVQEVMDIFGELKISLVAGQSGLANAITEVSIMEISIHDDLWVVGGELILSTLSTYKTPQEVTDLMTMLARKKVAALLVHPGDNEKLSLDQSILAAADHLGLPILTVPRQVAYVKIIKAVYSYILNKQALHLQKSEVINRRLTSILISGGDTAEVTLALADLLKKPVLVLDENDQRVAQCGYSPLGQQILDSFEKRHGIGLSSSAHFRREKNEIFDCKYHFDGRDYQQTIYRLFLMGDYLGAIVVWSGLEHEEVDHQADLDGLYHAGTALSLIEMQNRATAEAEEKQIASFFDDLLSHRFETEDAIFMRAENLHISLNHHYQAIMIDIDAFEQYCLANAHKGEKYFQFIKSRLGRIIKAALIRLNDKSKILTVSDCFVAFLEIPPQLPGGALQSKLRDIFDDIHREIRTNFNNLTVTIGVGTLKPSLLMLPKSFEEARKTISIGRKVYGINNTYYYENMGIYGLLLVDSMEELQENYAAALSELSHKELNQTLLDTLEVYLDSSESTFTTAKLLNVHPNTVKYRVKRAINILGEKYLADSEEKLKLYILLKMRKVL